MHTQKCNTLEIRARAPIRLKFGVIVCATLVLGACASIGQASPQSLVTQRANARWKALLSTDYGSAYTYNTPGFRAVVSPDSYRNRVGAAVKWLGAEAVKVECPESNKCNAIVRIDYRPMLGGSSGAKFSTHIDETWLLEDGNWWIFQPLQGN